MANKIKSQHSNSNYKQISTLKYSINQTIFVTLKITACYKRRCNMNETKTNRSDSLSALCILTFIGSTTSFVTYFLASVFFEKTAALIIKYSNWHSTDAITPLYFTVLMALSAVSLTGAIRIWKLHRDGFYIYSITQIIILFIPVIWLDWNAFSATGAIFTAVFVVGYGINLKSMKS